MTNSWPACDFGETPEAAEFTAMYTQYRGVVLAAIYRTTRGWVRAPDKADLEQAVWVRVWQTMQPGSGAAYNPARSRRTTWLHLITRSVLANQFAKNSHDPTNWARRLPVPSAWPQQRDTRFEERQVAADLLQRFRVLAAEAEDAAQLLSCMAACQQVERVTATRLAAELGTSRPVARRLLGRMRLLLRQLGA